MTENQEFIRSSHPSSSDYIDEVAGLRDLYRSSPIPNEELMINLRSMRHQRRCADKIFGAVVTRG